MPSVLRKTFSERFSFSRLSALNHLIHHFCNTPTLRDSVNLNLSIPSCLNSSHYMKILQLCVEKEARKQGRSIHARIVTNGFDSDLHLDTKLVIFYVKIDDVAEARKVFDRMPDGSVVSWTAQISGYAKSGCFLDALQVFVEMRRAGVRANQFTYGSVLKACTGLRSLKRGMQIQGCIKKSRFDSNLIVQSALVDFHSKCGKMEDACYLFKAMPEKDLVSWNAVIGGYAVQGFADDSFKIFCSMRGEGLIPDWFTLANVLKASSTVCSLAMVYQMHKFIIQLGFELNISLTGSLIDAYAKCGSIRNAYQLYKSMPMKDLISCTALMKGYAHNSSYSSMAIGLFKELQQMHMHFDDVMLCSMLNICANIADLIMGKQIHALAFKYKSKYDVAMGNSLIDMYAKSGEIRDANRAFEEMEEKNVISWTSLITGYANHGCGHEAIALYKRMECDGLRPNGITFLSLLFACSHSGLSSEGWVCFRNMIKKYDILLQVEHLSCMIDLFARGGQLEEAYNMICKVNCKSSPSLWGAFLGACGIHDNMHLGKLAAMHLFDKYPENSVNYAVLANIYAAAGEWDSSWKLRNLMEERNLKKVPGYSLVHSTMKNVTLL